MAAIRSTQTRNPNAFQKDPTRHYVRVQLDSKDYESPIDDYLSKSSIVNPENEMYREESRDRKISGDRRMALLSCSEEDYDAQMKEISDEAGVKQTSVEKDESKGAETFRRGVIDPNE